nr:zonadhesin-like [Onthophagus taurus]
MSLEFLHKFFAAFFLLCFHPAVGDFNSIYLPQTYAINYEQPTIIICGDGQYFDNCASPCPVTCGNINNPPYCPAICTKGCTCINRRYVYDSSTGRCVPPEYCPVQTDRCRHNQTYYQTNFNGPTCDGVVIGYNQPGCYCGNRFVLNRLTGRCVLPRDCPKYPRDQVCPNNEYVNSCKNPCEATCRNPVDKICPIPQCIYGCSCKKGLVRDESSGKCIDQCYCPKNPNTSKCEKGEEFSTCGSLCEPTCKNPQRTCNSNCVKGCFCKRGYVRMFEDGGCVPPGICPYIL